MRQSTTLPLDAKAVHEIGLAEMARIHAQIDAVMKQTGFTGSYAEFADQLGHDPKYYYTSGDDAPMTLTIVNVGHTPDTLTSVWIRAWANAFGGCRVS